MLIVIASLGGGQGKTVTAVMLSAYFQSLGPTVLIDGDPNRSALKWSKKGKLSFDVISHTQALTYRKKTDYQVIDTKARPEPKDILDLVEGCDFMVVPSQPDGISLEKTVETVRLLYSVKFTKFKALLTIVPPKPITDGEDARVAFQEAGAPLFKTDIRRFRAYQKAYEEGVPVNLSNHPKAAEAWSDYVKVAEELLR